MDLDLSRTDVAGPDFGQGPAQSLFQCGECKRVFSRVDHLTRHIRAHTKEKPYVCPVCSKCFARVDLLKRHGQNHNRPAESRQKQTPSPRPTRVSQACEPCSQLHLRCEETKPCRRCKKKRLVCGVVSLSRQVTSDNNEPDAVSAAVDLLGLADAHRAEGRAVSGFLDDSITHQQCWNNDHVGGQLPPIHQPTPPSIALGQSNHENTREDQSNLPVYEAHPFEDLADVTADLDLPEFLRGIPTFSDPFNSGTLSGTWTPRGAMDFGLHSNFDFNDLDLSFLDKYNEQIPFDAVTASAISETTPRNYDADIDVPEMLQNGVTNRTEALKKSVWRFIPVPQQDHGAAEEQNLALPEADNNNDTPESRINLPRRASSDMLDRASRDMILTLVLGSIKPVNVSRIVSAFPSLELLDSLLQYYLTSPYAKAETWLHIPTFSPTAQKRPELLAAVIAAGAVLTPDVPLRKLGFALQEAVRMQIPQKWEDDNSLVRDLQLLQGFTLQLEIALWSGISRKIEIAESFLQPLVTMLRRGGKFRYSSYERTAPRDEDCGEELEKKWCSWIEQESYLRLVYRVFQLDAQCSMALSTKPLIAYSEMQMPLPETSELWYASNSELWKMTYLFRKQSPSRSPSLVDCLDDLEFLDGSRHSINTSVSSLGFLYAVWGLIREFQQLKSIRKRQSKQWNDPSITLASRHDELLRVLEHFSIICETIGQGTNLTLEIVLELLHLHLHLSLENVQLFAGLEGQEEAKRVFPALKEWSATSASRQAIWHAGQILRAVRKVPPSFARDFTAIALYHASLAFWAYGLIVGAGPSPQNGAHGRVVLLDEPDSIDVKRFVALERGAPALSRPGTPLALTNVGEVMELLVETLRMNHNGIGGPLPPLVENLIQLMESLRLAAK